LDNQVGARTGASVPLSLPLLFSGKRWIGRPLYGFWCGLRVRNSKQKKAVFTYNTRDHVPRWWNSAWVLRMVVVVRGSTRMRARVNEGEAERRKTSARSYAPVLILILALAKAVLLGLRVTQEGIVGRGRVSELLLLSLLIVVLSPLLGLALTLIGTVVVIVRRWRARRLGACYIYSY
jgi:hypothetical protein